MSELYDNLYEEFNKTLSNTEAEKLAKEWEKVIGALNKSKQLSGSFGGGVPEDRVELDDMADTGYENMGEESGYILSELKLAVRKMMELIEAKADASQIQSVWKSAEKLFASKEDFNSLVKFVDTLSEQSPQLEEMRTALNALANEADDFRIYREVLTVPSAEVLALNATPKQILPTPGAGKYIDIIHIEVKLDYNSVAYVVDPGEDLSFEYSAAGQIVQLSSAGLLDQTTVTRKAAGPGTDVPVGVDEAVLLKILSGEVLNGDSDLRIRVDYRILEAL